MINMEVTLDEWGLARLHLWEVEAIRKELRSFWDIRVSQARALSLETKALRNQRLQLVLAIAIFANVLRIGRRQTILWLYLDLALHQIICAGAISIVIRLTPLCTLGYIIMLNVLLLSFLLSGRIDLLICDFWLFNKIWVLMVLLLLILFLNFLLVLTFLWV